MSIDAILGIDDSDPASRHAEFLVEADTQLMRQLVAFRKARKIDQATVALHMGIDPSGVSKIESGHRDLLQSTIQRYAMAVGAVIEHRVVSFDAVDTSHTTQSPDHDQRPSVRR